jgi:hypothetical protein
MSGVLSDPAPTVPAVEPLTDLEKKILDFEHGRWLHQGAKDEAVLKAFGMTPVRYQQYVLHLLEKPAALAYDPMLVKRLRRLRDTRRRQRTG